MKFGYLFLFALIAYYSWYNIILPLREWLGYQARFPEYRRDKYKRLQAGQIWTDNRRYCTIQWIYRDQIRYSIYSPQSSFGSFRFEFHETAEQFRKLIDGERFHLTDELPS